MTDIAPVQEQSRIKSLDVMRGFALLGILAVNAAYFAGPWQSGFNPLTPPLAVDESTLWSWFVMHVFFEFKCITLFSLLFGASIYLVGGERNDKARGEVLTRRLVWLLVFGLIHALLIWYGDILVTYAITGFIVMLARSWKPPTLITVGVLLYLLAFALQSVMVVFVGLLPASKLGAIEADIAAIFVQSPEELARMQAAYQDGVLSGLRENLNTWLQFLSSGLIGMVIRTAGVMMIGMALFKTGFLSGKAPSWVYALLLVIGAAALGVIAYQAWLNWQARFELMHMISYGTVANIALSIFGTLGYISLLVLLVKAGARFVTEPLAAVGRMAFTNYISQSLIMTTIFYGGRGFGLWGEVDRPTLWAIVVAIWVLQLIWSPLWLAKFQMGPLEWLWRRLSYGKPVAMAKTAPARGAVVEETR
ncbi:MAG TPA: DUF418 domain-containing protein [Vitreimonas sp.]|uniref:DUF418 domain-containing protein n=1 Tax=Vitreimonas sp. TaxID=3069702 RepID=UPI002D5FD88A|nr:DUF418 domain-containing protein [Vitreimonas sp.]HYD87083.1 DUF418 domain-containing protein [Vitreimonas sp.]